MGMLVIYNQDVVKEICNVLKINIEDEPNVRVHLNTNTHNVRIISSKHIVHDTYIKPEIIKILDKHLLNLI